MPQSYLAEMRRAVISTLGVQQMTSDELAAHLMSESLNLDFRELGWLAEDLDKMTEENLIGHRHQLNGKLGLKTVLFAK